MGISLVFLVCIFISAISLAIFHSAWWWIASLVSGWLVAARWHIYYSRAWRRFHFPFMRAYAASAGAVAATSESPFGRDQVRSAALITIRGLSNTKSEDADESLLNFVDLQWNRCETLSDLCWLEDRMRRKLAGTEEDRVKRLIDAMIEEMQTPDNGLLIRYVVAGIIGENCGNDEREEYLFEVWCGNAF